MTDALSRTLSDFAILFRGMEIEGGALTAGEARAFAEAFDTMAPHAARLEREAAAAGSYEPVDLTAAFGPDGESLEGGTSDEDARIAWAAFEVDLAIKRSDGRVVRLSDRRRVS